MDAIKLQARPLSGSSFSVTSPAEEIYVHVQAGGDNTAMSNIQGSVAIRTDAQDTTQTAFINCIDCESICEEVGGKDDKKHKWKLNPNGPWTPL